MREWTPRALAAVRRAAELHGLRAVCARCGHECRHFPSAGRLRDAKCPRCELRTLRLYSWARRYPARWAQVQREARDVHA